MKQEKKILTQEEIFREKVDHYEVCFIDHCPLHEQCLRWLVGQYADTTRVMFTSINIITMKMQFPQHQMK